MIEYFIAIFTVIGGMYFCYKVGQVNSSRKTFRTHEFKQFLEFYEKNKERIDGSLQDLNGTTITAHIRETPYGDKIKKWVIKNR